MFYVMQVPLSSSEIEALKDSRQAAHAEDWLMDGEAVQAQGETPFCPLTSAAAA